jgi:hypothetical protein
MKVSTQQPYVLFGTPSAQAAHVDFCEKHRQPIIYAERKGKLCRVTMDLIFCEKAQRFNESPVFLEKIYTIHDQVQSERAVQNAGLYTYLERVDPAYAEFVLQSYLAIYQQEIGQQAQAPAFPFQQPENTNRTRLSEARALHYCVTHTVNDPLLLRWESFCKAYDWPYVRIHEARKGMAMLEINLPEGKTFSVEALDVMKRAGQELGIKSIDDRIQSGDKWYSYGSSSFKTVRAISTGFAQYFARVIVHTLVEQNYFPAIDESWHA